MADILVRAENDVKVAAADVLRFVTGSARAAVKLEPAVIAVLAILLDLLRTQVVNNDNPEHGPLGLLGPEVLADIRDNWPALQALAELLGIRL